ncbi:MAG: alpha/beta hydrolase [Candidatus Hydrogenedentes bacterium]|nr:alpha/beta hydrolase [Candidatus Hydrogenedentota bacterium]
MELLWPAGAPGALGDKDADKPALTPYLLKDGKPHPAVIICPGGGYAGLCWDYEGTDVAEWLNSAGVAAFVLRYRVSPYKHPIPLHDAQRAIRTVRARAAEWGVDPARIGILGFSAGGHLSATAGTHFDKGDPKAADPIDRAGCRPNFLILIYPVITMSDSFVEKGSRGNLLGKSPDPELLKSLSNELQVTPNTPPAFLVTSTKDSVVPAENSIQFYLAQRAAKLPAELHVYERGEHGFGMGKGDPSLTTWPPMCLEWMRGLKLLTLP